MHGDFFPGVYHSDLGPFVFIAFEFLADGLFAADDHNLFLDQFRGQNSSLDDFLRGVVSAHSVQQYSHSSPPVLASFFSRSCSAVPLLFPRYLLRRKRRIPPR